MESFAFLLAVVQITFGNYEEGECMLETHPLRREVR